LTELSAEDLENASATGPEETSGPAAAGEPRRVRKHRVRGFFFPPHGSSVWLRILPWGTLFVILVGLFVGLSFLWQYTNSPAFCGETCHTMPPEYAAYQLSPHAQVRCVECHIGRDSFLSQLVRKSGHLKLIFQTVFHDFSYPIYATSMRPAPQICEKCHSPEKFSNDSLIVETHYAEDEQNTVSYTYLLMHTGGGTKREGLGFGIHWHIEENVQFYATDELQQNIPYIKVTYDDGTVQEYVDVTSGFDKSKIKPGDLKQMDCMTCHNRVTHTIPFPAESVDSSMARGVIASDIPFIRKQAVAVLTASYPTDGEAFAQIAKLDSYYRQNYPDYYANHGDKIKAAITELQRIYSVSVFSDQKLDWNTHPNNLGHIYSAGCFRCHDGKHLDAQQQAVRLECNLCHSIPLVASSANLVIDLEINRGPEPSSHLNANWISLHNQAFDSTCSNCHTTDDPGGTSNTSFCSNPACHGTVFKFAGFNAPALREILANQLPSSTTVTTSPTASQQPTYDSYAGPLFTAKCGSCHGGATPTQGLDLTTYAGAIKGAQDGPVIIPGNSAGSKLVQVQSGQHFANLSQDELQTIIKWIDAGAPEK
jgi:hypothetical protein